MATQQGKLNLVSDDNVTPNIDIQTIVRGLLSVIGAYLLGKNLFGIKVDDQLWQEFAGAIMALVALIWGILDKTATIEMVQSGIRIVLSFAGGIFVSKGVFTSDIWITIMGVVSAILPIVYSHLSKLKTKNLVTGKLPIQELKK
jgi:hypothetical protein